MTELTSSQIDQLRQQLLGLQDELHTLLATSAESVRPVSLDQPIGRLSRIDAIQQQQMAQANRHAYEIRLRQIQAALAAMADDEYGYCKSCDDPIGYARLSVRPEAPFCLSCQERRELRR
jgi:DnaK suppressor protein